MNQSKLQKQLEQAHQKASQIKASTENTTQVRKVKAVAVTLGIAAILLALLWISGGSSRDEGENKQPVGTFHQTEKGLGFNPSENTYGKWKTEWQKEAEVRGSYSGVGPHFSFRLETVTEQGAIDETKAKSRVKWFESMDRSYRGIDPLRVGKFPQICIVESGSNYSLNLEKLEHELPEYMKLFPDDVAALHNISTKLWEARNRYTYSTRNRLAVGKTAALAATHAEPDNASYLMMLAKWTEMIDQDIEKSIQIQKRAISVSDADTRPEAEKYLSHLTDELIRRAKYKYK